MMTVGVPVEANKALIRRFIEEVHNKGNFALFNELFAPNYVNHSAPANQNDHAAREQGIRSYRAAAPDLRVTIDDMIAEGDKVALRWTTHGTEGDHCARRSASRRRRIGRSPFRGSISSASSTGRSRKNGSSGIR